MDPADQPAAADDAGPTTTSEDKTASSRSPITNSPTTGRSYECTFCKRGFSNAQALGGHMNIHRKDRAKLKQPPNLQAAAQHFPFSLGTSPRISEYPSTYTVMPWANPSSSPKQLQPLFVDGPSSRREDTGPREKEQGPELDLELRLGPDAAAMGLKEFV